MNKQQTKLLVDAFPQGMKVKALPTDLPNAVQIKAAYVDRNGEPFTFYAYTRAGAKKIFLTDAAALRITLERSGMSLNLALVQKMMSTYGLTVIQDGAVVDQTDRPLGQRVNAMFQAWAAADGVLRLWTMEKN